MTVGEILDDIEDMESILNRIKLNENDSSYYEIGFVDVSTLRKIFRNYKSMLCNLEIEEKK